MTTDKELLIEVERILAVPNFNHAKLKKQTLQRLYDLARKGAGL